MYRVVPGGIEALIAADGLLPGQRLPAERGLSARLGMRSGSGVHVSARAGAARIATDPATHLDRVTRTFFRA